MITMTLCREKKALTNYIPDHVSTTWLEYSCGGCHYYWLLPWLGPITFRVIRLLTSFSQDHDTTGTQVHKYIHTVYTLHVPRYVYITYIQYLVSDLPLTFMHTTVLTTLTQGHWWGWGSTSHVVTYPECLSIQLVQFPHQEPFMVSYICVSQYWA